MTGSVLTITHVQMSFPLEISAAQKLLGDSSPHLQALLARLHVRPAYKAALAKGGPYVYAM